MCKNKKRKESEIIIEKRKNEALSEEEGRGKKEC